MRGPPGPSGRLAFEVNADLDRYPSQRRQLGDPALERLEPSLAAAGQRGVGQGCLSSQVQVNDVGWQPQRLPVVGVRTGGVDRGLELASRVGEERLDLEPGI